MVFNTVNPFSSCFLKPGANRYLFNPQDHADSVEGYSEQRVLKLVAELLSSRAKRFCIVGPHGTGKSTLMVQIMNSGQVARVPHARVQLSSEDRNTAEMWRLQKQIDRGVFAVDGYEQLSWFCKLKLVLATWRSGQRLIVTAHEPPLGFRVIHQTSRTEATDAHIVHSLLRDSSGKANELLASSFWRASRQRHGQNLRESLFDAYDWFEENYRN